MLRGSELKTFALLTALIALPSMQNAAYAVGFGTALAGYGAAQPQIQQNQQMQLQNELLQQQIREQELQNQLLQQQLEQQQQYNKKAKQPDFSQQFSNKLKSAQNECFAKYGKEYKTMVATQKCYNSILHKALKTIHYPYKDLEAGLVAKYIDTAKKFDQKKIALEDANAEDNAATSQFLAESQKRSAMAARQ